MKNWFSLNGNLPTQGKSCYSQQCQVMAEFAENVLCRCTSSSYTNSRVLGFFNLHSVIVPI